jgi:hypothetical protein
VAIPEQPVLVGEGRPFRYHTATDVDILAVRFPNAAIVVPRDSGQGRTEEDLQLAVDPKLELHPKAVDVIVGEVKQSRPRLNPALREPDVLYATLRRVDPGFDEPLSETIAELIAKGEAHCESGGRRWRFRLFAFGEGTPVMEAGPYASLQLSHVAMFLIQCMREHHQVWKDAQFGDPVLDLLHLFDKMGFSWVANARVEQAAAENEPVSELGLEERDPILTSPALNGRKTGAHKRARKPRKAAPPKKNQNGPAAESGTQASSNGKRKAAPKKRKTKLTTRVHAGGRHHRS